MKNREEIEGYQTLKDLALDLTWSWENSTYQIWQQLDPQIWELTHNPLVLLQTVSKEKLESVLADRSFRKTVEDLTKSKQAEAKASTWFQKTYSASPLKCAAYFSMEFMLSEALPIYSGGLGNVAGDQLKTASDLGVPVVGVGILYQQGYFRQMIDKEGAQQALYPYNDPGQLPIVPLRKANGEWLRLEIALPGWSVWLRAWEVKVGRVKLYLLDSNDAVNIPIHRGITSELYGGGSELRLKQELVLGIGGWRLLKELGLKPEVCHLNEGHAAFAVLERAKCFMKETGVSFEIALSVTRVGNLFTTHTAVPAGFDRFSPSLIEQYLSKYAKENLGLSLHDLLALGRQDPNNSEEPFNMAYLAVHGSGAVNGVSRLHGKVSRYIFQSLFPRWPEDDVPVGYVTNGVHVPTWDSVGARNLWTETCGKNRWLGETETLEKDLRAVPDTTLWKMRNEGRKRMLDYARTRLSHMWEARGFPPEEVARAKTIFDPNTLTMGFARRFATYKRPNMLLHDTDRLLRILANPQRPVQLVISGKAHPADKPGQAMIRQWIQLFHTNADARKHIIFLTDYDMLVTQNLVQGVDVWINTPRRPWEACGTSGMKVLVNGGLNLSELDGWWAEAYAPELGWAIGDGNEHGEDPAWDASEAYALYDLLEHHVVPEFYTRNADGIPKAWLARIRESMARLTGPFSANRSVREYTEKHYLPAATNYLKRAANQGALAKQIIEWQHSLEQNWPLLRFSEERVDTQNNQHNFEVQVYLNSLNPKTVKVELYSNNPPLRQEMTYVKELADTPSTHVFRTSIAATHPPAAYTARLIPHFAGAAVPLEAPHILWQR